MFPLFYLDRVSFFNLLTVMGIKFVDITFSIMKSDKFVIGAVRFNDYESRKRCFCFMIRKV